jgi:hypothetical protein
MTERESAPPTDAGGWTRLDPDRESQRMRAARRCDIHRSG